MWKSLSIKSQLILILLLPVSGLIYMTINNINTSLKNYNDIDKSILNTKNITSFSKGISSINDESALYIYSQYDSTYVAYYENKKQETLDWLNGVNSIDPIISKTKKEVYRSLLELHDKIKNKSITQSEAFKAYIAINEILDKLIKREIVLSESSNITLLANNYTSYVDSKRIVLRIRGIVLKTLIENNLDQGLLELYNNSKRKSLEVDFIVNSFGLARTNMELIKYRKSEAYKTFLLSAEQIINGEKKMLPEAWRLSTEAVVSKVNKLEKNNLNLIIEYSDTEKKGALYSIFILIAILSIFLLVTILLLYKLVKNLSLSLNMIANSIKKISQGKIIKNRSLRGNSEFLDINNSFIQLLSGIKEQYELSSKISAGDYGGQINLRSSNDTLNNSMNKMSLELEQMNLKNAADNKMKQSIFEVNKAVVNSHDLKEFGTNICKTIVTETQSCQANFYILSLHEDTNQLHKIGGYADDENTPKIINVGEGLIGNAVISNQQSCMNDLPNNYSYITSSLGKAPVYNVLITPISFKDRVIGVIEVGSLTNFVEEHKKFMRTVTDSLGSAIEVYIRNEELKTSVEEINHKNNELQVQEEELRQSNEELNKQSLLLQQSEEELRNQAAELEQTNAYLEEKGRELENKHYEVSVKNDELVIAQEELSFKSEEIAQASKYKSEFLANMSHELRTPLNSILILSDLLRENNLGNLTDPQIDNLSVINSSGKDLLNLITDILDISKIEAGKVEVYPEESIVERVFSDMDGLFRAQMEKKKITFSTTISDNCPRKLHTDIGKLEQILKNFLSNALKFTPEKGVVSLKFEAAEGKNNFVSPTLNELNSDQILCIHIEDSGIGISDANKKKLFQTFQQADSSTSRKYGGTGLGLFISKELAILLGGEVEFTSELNKGSVFSVYVPIIYKTDTDKKNVSVVTKKTEVKVEETIKPSVDTLDLAEHLNDDRNILTVDDKTILIIEDDASFAEVLMKVAHENGFKAVLAYQGETGFQYAKKYKPKAIILDMKLPGIDGWTVLKWLKEDKELKHIPVHVMSGMDREKLAKEMGAFGFLVKPITTDKLKSAFDSIDDQISKVFKKVLILEDDVNLNYSIKELIHNCDRNVICIQAHTFKEAENILKNDDIDCAIMDIGLPDSENIANISALRKISKNDQINIIVNTGKSLTDEEELELKNSANGIIIKTNNVTERLKDELLLFFDTVDTADSKTPKVTNNVLGGDILKGKNILIVDDDIRNIYALSSALTTKGALIMTAFNGIEALEVMNKNANIDIVLMDIMMPEMDGYEATRKIRENEKWKNLPIIALTAKAMKGDREEILNAGASDYQSKPIDIQQLISLISIWIYK